MRWDEMLFAAQTFRCFWKRDLGRRWWQPSQSQGWGPVQGGGKGVLEVCTPILDTAGCCLGLSPVIPTWKAASYTNSHIPPPRADAGGAVWSLWCQHVSTHACLQLATPWWGWGAPCPPLCLAPGGCGSLFEARSLRNLWGTAGQPQPGCSLSSPPCSRKEMGSAADPPLSWPAAVPLPQGKWTGSVPVLGTFVSPPDPHAAWRGRSSGTCHVLGKDGWQLLSPQVSGPCITAAMCWRPWCCSTPPTNPCVMR